MNTSHLAPRANSGGALPAKRFVRLKSLRVRSQSPIRALGIRLRSLLLIASHLLPVAQGLAASATLGWDANTEPDISGYELRYGESSGNYTSTLQVGKTTEASVSNLTEGKTYYFAVVAFNTSGLASAPSNEVVHQVATTPVNTAPTALAQSVTTQQNKPVSIVLGGSDPETNPLAYMVVSNPTKGTLSGTAPNLTYLPNADFSGTDSFTFKANDGQVDSAPATVNIEVTKVVVVPVNPPTAIIKIPSSSVAGQPVTLDGSGSLGAETWVWDDAAGSPGQYPLGNGEIVQFTFNNPGTKQIRLTVTNADGSSAAVQTLVVESGVTNQPPVALAQSVTTAEDKSVPVVLGGSDPEKSPLTYLVVSNPTKGTLGGTAPNLTYTPSKGYSGPDSFTFTVSDGSLVSTAATVSITVTPVNKAPTALAQSVTTPKNKSIPIVLGGSDPEKSPLTYAVVAEPKNGTLSGTLPNLTYKPSSGYSGPDSLTFTVSDGSLVSSAATVSITVTAVNGPPVAKSFAVQTTAGAPEAIVLSGSDPDGDAPTFNIISDPTKGSLSGTPPNLTYQPNPDATGSDQFTYLASDGSLNSEVATVSINITPAVNEVPVFSPTFTTSSISMAGTVGSPLGGQLTASHPVPEEVLTFSKVSGPGWLVVSPSGALGGTPQDADLGTNQFVVEVSDGSGESDQADLTISVFAAAAVNRAPVFIGNPIYSADASENAAYTGQSLAGQAVDPDAGDTITYWKISGPDWLNIARDGQLSGTPSAGSAGNNSFHIRAVDSSLATVDTELRINVVGLPLPWRSSDLGWGQFPGSVSFLNGSFTQTGSGSLGQASDKTRSTYQTFSGNGSIIAKVRLDSNSGPEGYAGIMIRDSMGPRSRQIFLGLGSDGSYRLMRRAKAGAKASVRYIAKDPGSDTWVRLVRNVKQKSVFAYKSADGINWTYLGATKIPFARTCHVGMAVSSGSDFTQAVATFGNLYVGP